MDWERMENLDEIEKLNTGERIKDKLQPIIFIGVPIRSIGNYINHPIFCLNNTNKPTIPNTYKCHLPRPQTFIDFYLYLFTALRAMIILLRFVL